jgi:hypothetical protein
MKISTSHPFEIDRAAFDKKIRELQSLPTPIAA